MEKENSVLILFGNKTEAPLNNYLKESLGLKHKKRIIDIVGKTTIRQAAALLKFCRLFIGNDSGSMHVAAAMKVPLVEICMWPKNGNKLSPRSPYRFGPWETAAIIVNPDKPTPPCLSDCKSEVAHCILQVKVEDVYEAAEKLLKSENYEEN